jgi:hypothetical protein
LVAFACGPSSGNRGDNCDPSTDPTCVNERCTAGKTKACYTGAAGTEGVGACHGGTITCGSDNHWGACQGQQTPIGEICGNSIDDDCNGQVDEDTDADGDGWTTCGGDCCDNTLVCSNPAEVNPGAWEAPGDNVDNDCDGTIDNTILSCDTSLSSSSQNGYDFASAIDICPSVNLQGAALMNDPMRHWGILDAVITLPQGTGAADPNAYSIRPHWGTGVLPQGGVSMALISSGVAAGKGDTNPAYHDFVSYTGTVTSNFPADFLAANGGTLPNAPGCPPPNGNTANDPVMLQFTIRVPTNAHSFSLKVNFFSAEFPEWTCTEFNDFFVVLLDSMYNGSPANPTDKNLAFYTPMGTTQKVPVGVNLAAGNTGLFTQCVNGTTGCAGSPMPGSITTCTGTQQLANTGMDDADPLQCDTTSLKGGGTGWLQTSGNVKPGETMKLRIAIWDTSDHAYDSLAVVDGFQWSADTSNPGTVIFRQDGSKPKVEVTQEAIHAE